MRRAPLFALVVAACTTGPPPARTAGAPTPFAASGCADTPALTREATALLAQGRLTRAATLLERANLQCPASAAPLRGWLAELDAEVGYPERAAAMLDVIARDPHWGRPSRSRHGRRSRSSPLAGPCRTRIKRARSRPSTQRRQRITRAPSSRRSRATSASGKHRTRTARRPSAPASPRSRSDITPTRAGCSIGRSWSCGNRRRAANSSAWTWRIFTKWGASPSPPTVTSLLSPAEGR